MVTGVMELNIKRKGLLLVTLLICILFTLGITIAPVTADTSQQPIKNLIVHYIDVGQADSILIQTPNNKNILIDTGNNADSQSLMTYLKAKGVGAIDVLVGTHPHEDHIGSMDDVIRNLTVNSIYMPKVTTNTDTFLDLLQAIKDKGLKVNTPVPGSKIVVDSDLDVTIVAPNNTTYEDLNNYSIVLKVTYKNNSFLFTGDAEAASEAEILKAAYNIKADVLKVAHHGSYSSTSDAFLKSVAPKYAVISVGKGNDYGHPAADTLTRLTNHKVEIFRTDLSGTIIATSDGNMIRFDKSASIASIITTAPIVPVTTEQYYIGNINSKVFHKTTCSSLPLPKNQVRFNSREEAIKAGYRPCQRCNP